MKELIELLQNLLTSQPLLQVFAGCATLVLIAYMVLRAIKDKESLLKPAPLPDVPPVFSQGPREVIELVREQRESLRRVAEDTAPMRECLRIMREQSAKQTEVLEEIANELRTEHRLTAERSVRR